MVNISAKEYILEFFIISLILFFIFIFLYQQSNKLTLKESIYLFGLFIVFFSLQILINDWADLVYILGIYLFFKNKEKVDYFLIEIIFISILTVNISNILQSICMTLINDVSTNGYAYIILNEFFNLFITIIILQIYKKIGLLNKLKKHSPKLVLIILIYSSISITFFISLMQKYNTYTTLINEVILFLILQSSFMVFVFIYDRKRQKEKYKQNIIEEKSKNLELYTQSLEKEQLKLRKFKHDYKNMIVSLRSFTSRIPELDETINKFDDYSSDYFKGQFLNQYKDLRNVENSYLKSLLISKFHTISLNETKCTFECRNKINNSSINIFDLIRLLGISIDNAIESTKGQSNGEINISIVKENNQLLFLINNTSSSTESVHKLVSEGYSTKKGHSGLGLSNIQEIKKKYPDNIISKYEKSDKWFKLELIIK